MSATPSGKTDKVTVANLLDPRLEPDTVAPFAAVLGPVENTHYSLNASSVGNDSILINNIVTRGAGRGYLNTFELEVTARLTVEVALNEGATGSNIVYEPAQFMLNSFPLSRCAANIHVTLNGTGIDSQPQQYIRAKERYWSQERLDKSYANVCPAKKCWMASELPRNYMTGESQSLERDWFPYRRFDRALYTPYSSKNEDCILPGYHLRAQLTAGSPTATLTATYRWREPIFCTPFASRYDETWGKPIYGLTSLDIAYTLQGLQNMFNIMMTPLTSITSFNVDILDAVLRYQVLTTPPEFPIPTSITLPYRRMVPYATPVTLEMKPGSRNHFMSGVYTLNQVPNAIWVYVGPKLADLQTAPYDYYPGSVPAMGPGKSYSYNKLFAPIANISISCANTTRILANAQVEDLYRIAKTNGCEDSFTSWGRLSYSSYRSDMPDPAESVNPVYNPGAGSCLRLIPGVDIILPDQQLVPGANAKDMVFQVEGDWLTPPNMPDNYRDCALWLIMEYVGVLTITPGSCNVDLNPIAKDSFVATPLTSAEAVNATQSPSLGEMEGSGFWDKVLKGLKAIHSYAKKYKIPSKLAKYIPTVGEPISQALDMLGYGYRGVPMKRPRMSPSSVSGGKVMDLSDFT